MRLPRLLGATAGCVFAFAVGLPAFAQTVPIPVRTGEPPTIDGNVIDDEGWKGAAEVPLSESGSYYRLCRKEFPGSYPCGYVYLGVVVAGLDAHQDNHLILGMASELGADPVNAWRIHIKPFSFPIYSGPDNPPAGVEYWRNAPRPQIGDNGWNSGDPGGNQFGGPNLWLLNDVRSWVTNIPLSAGGPRWSIEMRIPMQEFNMYDDGGAWFPPRPGTFKIYLNAIDTSAMSIAIQQPAPENQVIVSSLEMGTPNVVQPGWASGELAKLDLRKEPVQFAKGTRLVRRGNDWKAETVGPIAWMPEGWSGVTFRFASPQEGKAPATGGAAKFKTRVQERQQLRGEGRVVTGPLPKHHLPPDALKRPTREVLMKINENPRELTNSVLIQAELFARTGTFLTIEGRRFENLADSGHFDIPMTEERKIEEWNLEVDVKDAKVRRLVPGLYSLTFQSDSSPVLVVTRNPSFFKQFGVYARAGYATSYGKGADDLEDGFSTTLGAEYRFDRTFAAGVRVGIVGVDGESGDEDLDIQSVSVEGKAYLFEGSWKPFLSVGAGYYALDEGDNEFGMHATGGVRYSLTDSIGIEAAATVHKVFAHDDTLDFATLEAGVSFRF